MVAWTADTSMRLAWLVGLMLLSPLVGGCIGTADQPGRTIPTEQQPSEATAGAEAGPGGEQTTEVAWNRTDVVGPAALRGTVHVPQEAECQIEALSTGHGQGPGPYSLFLLETETSTVWLTASASSESHLHVAHLDTRQSDGGGFNWARSTTVGGPMQGSLKATLVAVGLEPWENPLTEGVSLGLAIACDDGFTVEGLEGSRQAMVADAESMEGGAGASTWRSEPVFLDAEASIQDGIRSQLDTASAHVYADAYEVDGAAVTQLDVQGPDEAALWDLSTYASSEMRSLEGDGGAWSVDLRRAGAGAALPFWLALFGLDPIDDIGELAAQAPGS